MEIAVALYLCTHGVLRHAPPRISALVYALLFPTLLYILS